MSEKFIASKSLLTGAQKKLTNIFGDVVLLKKRDGYVASFSKDVRIPSYGGSITYRELSSDMVSRGKPTQAGAVKELFRLLDTNRGRPFLVKDEKSDIASDMYNDLINVGFAEINLPRVK